MGFSSDRMRVERLESRVDNLYNELVQLRCIVRKLDDDGYYYGAVQRVLDQSGEWIGARDKFPVRTVVDRVLDHLGLKVSTAPESRTPPKLTLTEADKP